MSDINMIVCLKQVPDPEAPPDAFNVDTTGMKVIPSANVDSVLGQYDEFALEGALKIKDEIGGKITAICLGNNLVRDVVKKPLSLNADELVLLEDEVFEDGDSWSTANALAAAIKKIGEYDIIFCGRQDSDWGYSQVGLGISELLGVPAVNIVQKIGVADGKAVIEQIVKGGYRVVESELPVLVTVSNEIGNLRYANLKGIMAAGKKQPIIWKPADIGLEDSQVGASGSRVKVEKLYQPIKEVECEIIEGESPEEAAVNLAVRLRDAKII